MKSDLSSIESDILQVLEVYDWGRLKTVYDLAVHLNYSEGYVNRTLKLLIESGDVDQIIDGQLYGKPRYIYKLARRNDVPNSGNDDDG